MYGPAVRWERHGHPYLLLRKGGGSTSGSAPHHSLFDACRRRPRVANRTPNRPSAPTLRRSDCFADDLLAGWAGLIDIPDQARIDPFAIRDLVGAIRICIVGASLPYLGSLNRCPECRGRGQDGECEYGAPEHGSSNEALARRRCV